MRCDKCGGKTRVYDTRINNQTKRDSDLRHPVFVGAMRRRRACLDCNWRITTYEVRGANLDHLAWDHKRLADIIQKLKDVEL